MNRAAWALGAAILAGCGASSKVREGGQGMLISFDSAKPLAQLQKDVPNACAAHQFGVMAMHDLKEKMKEKGVEYAGECLVFEVCNPQKARQALEACPEISTALPCRISVYRTKEGRTRLSTIRPTMLLDLYGAAGLKDVAAEVEAALEAIMKEAAQ